MCKLARVHLSNVTGWNIRLLCKHFCQVKYRRKKKKKRNSTTNSKEKGCRYLVTVHRTLVRDRGGGGLIIGLSLIQTAELARENKGSRGMK